MSARLDMRNAFREIHEYNAAAVTIRYVSVIAIHNITLRYSNNNNKI